MRSAAFANAFNHISHPPRRASDCISKGAAIADFFFLFFLPT